MTSRNMILIASVIVAAGILGGTLLSVAMASSGLWILSGPAAMAAAVIAAAYVLDPIRSGSVVAGYVLAAAVLAAGGLLASSDPSSLLSMMPIIGAAGGGVLVVDGGRCMRKISGQS